LGKLFRRKVVVDAQIEPSIIGGFIARIGDMLIDGSVHQKLETLKKNFGWSGQVRRRNSAFWVKDGYEARLSE